LKKIKIDVQDLLVVLEAMLDSGTRNIIFFEHNNLPAIADAEDPDNIITFQTYDPSEETKDGDSIH
jgi:hypothetical protein